LYNSLKKEIEFINNDKTRGQQIRAKCLHIELNEQSSKYFLSKEKSNAGIKSIKVLDLEDGRCITKQDEILSEQKSFYENLYREKQSVSDNEINEAEAQMKIVPKT
jgi:hypothetical protein